MLAIVVMGWFDVRNSMSNVVFLGRVYLVLITPFNTRCSQFSLRVCLVPVIAFGGILDVRLCLLECLTLFPGPLDVHHYFRRRT